MLLEERHHTIVHQVGGGERCLPVVELGERHLRIGVDRRLLVDAPHPFQRVDVECVLRHPVAWALALELAVCLLVESAFSSAATCASVTTKSSCALSSCFFIVSRSCLSRTDQRRSHLCKPTKGNNFYVGSNQAVQLDSLAAT
jgi:hypothetical protein